MCCDTVKPPVEVETIHCFFHTVYQCVETTMLSRIVTIPPPRHTAVVDKPKRQIPIHKAIYQD